MNTPDTEVDEMIAFVEVDGVGVALFKNGAGVRLTVSGSKEYVQEFSLLTPSTPDTKKYELGIEHSTGANSTRLLKDTTPDTEWRESIENILHDADISYNETKRLEKEIIPLIENAISSRDTYWKEKVRKERVKTRQDIEDALLSGEMKLTPNGLMLTPTNKDNLK